jgi:hypothetical protein
MRSLHNSEYKDTITVLLDVRTRWNSALDMLMSTLKWKTALVTSLHHLKSADRKKAFNRKTLPSMSEKVWIFIEGLCLVLTPFKRVTVYLSGEKYPTVASAVTLSEKIRSLALQQSIVRI